MQIKNQKNFYAVCVVSSSKEWKALKSVFPPAEISQSPYGEYFSHKVSNENHDFEIVFMHGHIGKIDAAASCQYAISTWHPSLIINLGTCGGFRGHINTLDTVLVRRTVVYDLFEKMYQADELIEKYATDIDLSWITEPLPTNIQKVVIASGDQDLHPNMISTLHSKYGAVVGDWESGSIARVCKKNGVPCLILRGVTDLVCSEKGDAYGDKPSIFSENTAKIMGNLLETLPFWLRQYKSNSNVGVKIS